MLRVQPRFERVAVLSRWRTDRFSVRDPELLGDEVEPGDGLGDRVLNLQPRVQLHEPEPVAGHEKLCCARALVAGRVPDREGGLDQRRAERLDPGRRRLLEHLLMAPLNRAVPRADNGQVAEPIAEKLNLDMSRVLDEALGEDRAVAERRPTLAVGGLDAGVQLGGTADDPIPRPPPPAAAFRISGNPTSSGAPNGTVGIPASTSDPFADSLSPARRMACGGGPTHLSPAASTASANRARSARKP